jgi:hypothetical protein
MGWADIHFHRFRVDELRVPGLISEGSPQSQIATVKTASPVTMSGQTECMLGEGLSCAIATGSLCKTNQPTQK